MRHFKDAEGYSIPDLRVGLDSCGSVLFRSHQERPAAAEIAALVWRTPCSLQEKEQAESVDVKNFCCSIKTEYVDDKGTLNAQLEITLL